MEGLTGIVDNSIVEKAVNETAHLAGKDPDVSFDPNMFMKILMAELQNQNPFDTADTNEILQQQAAMAEVEQSAKQSKTLESLAASVNQNFTLLQNQLDELKTIISEK
jgi:flagellar basal-body rod modification protein FlgD